MAEVTGASVFISHSSADSSRAREVCETLEREEDISCWIAPRDIRGGMSYPQAVMTGIERSRIVVVVVSESSNRSPEVLREIERASRLRREIVPFRIEDVEPSGGLAYFLSSVQWVDGFRPPAQRGLGDLLGAVRSALGAPAQEAPQTDERADPFEEVSLDDFGKRAPRFLRRLLEDR
jgi:hypothetical protein